MKFGIIEIGSTNTKGYIYDGKTLIDIGFKHIPFKNDYSLNKKIEESDVKLLYDFIKELQKQVPTGKGSI